MSSSIANAHSSVAFLVVSFLSPAVAGVAASYALLAVTFTPATSTLALFMPG